MTGPDLRNHVVLPPMPDSMPPPPRAGAQEIRLSGETMGTEWSLIAFAPDAPETGTAWGPDTRAQAQAIIEAECARIIALFSPWDDMSEVSQIHSNPTETVPVSAEFSALLEPLITISHQTGGASDPALGALTDLWGFGPPGSRGAMRLPPLPDKAQTDAARAMSGARQVSLSHGLLRRPPGLRFDFSGSAKGHCVDCISRRLEAEAGITSHLIGIGGEYAARGLRPDCRPWWVEVEQESPARRILVALSGHAMASSGDYRRFFHHEGRRYSHTIDPITGWPVAHDVASVTVLHDSVMQADALATALLVMGAGRGMAFADRAGIAAVMIRRGTDQAAPALFTPAMRRMMADDPQR